MTLQSMPSVPSFSDPSSSLVAHVPAIPANASATKPLEAPSTAIEPTVTAELRRPKSPVWGIEFDSINMDETIDAIDFLVGRKKACQVITANLNYVMLCQEHPVLTEVTQRAALTLCDGMPVLWRSRWTSVPLPERVAGADLIFRLCERAALRGHRIYFLGLKRASLRRRPIGSPNDTQAFRSQVLNALPSANSPMWNTKPCANACAMPKRIFYWSLLASPKESCGSTRTWIDSEAPSAFNLALRLTSSLETASEPLPGCSISDSSGFIDLFDLPNDSFRDTRKMRGSF